MAKGRQALPVIIQRLHQTYPDARYELNWNTPEQLLVGTILAAQSTDETVNQVTARLFRKYPSVAALADADLDELAEDVKQTGYYRKKADTVKQACQALIDNFGGQVPRDMDDMLTLPGVARKTANVVLTNAYKIPSGIVVDTHVARVSGRLGLTEEEKPEKIEADLMDQVPKSEWVFFGSAMVLHGRYTCTAANPQCSRCVLEDVCEKNGVDDTDTEVPQGEPAVAKKADSRRKP